MGEATSLPRPIGRQLVVAAAMLFVAGVMAIAYSSRQTYREHVRQLEAEASTMAAAVVVHVNQYLTTAELVATAVSRHPAVWGLDPTGVRAVLEPMAPGRLGLLGNVLLSDRAGAPVAWARPPEPAVERAIDREWLAGIAAARHPALSRLIGEPTSSAHFVALGHPVVRPDGGVAGVLVMLVHLEALDRLLASAPLPPASVVTLTDETSIVVARSLEAGRFVGRPITPPGERRLPADVPAALVRVGADGIERAYGNAVVERGPWLASVGIPTAVAIARTRPIFVRNLSISVGMTLLVALLALGFVRRWLAAFGHLEGIARRVAKGDLSPLTLRPMPSAEMAHMQHAMAAMVTNLARARESIATQVDEERRMRQEVQSLQQQVVRQERLAAIGVLVSGVAHELNNPLQAILGFAELLQMQPGIPEHARPDLTLIQKESARASAIIRNLSRFGRQAPEPSPVRLRDVVASVMELRQRKIEEMGISVHVDEQSSATVLAVFTELQQVLLNFTINAEQALLSSDPSRKSIVIRTRDDDGYAEVEVEDSGPGVAAEDEAKLFQPFYTTKPAGEGTGLGLSVSYDIIRMHGGRIGYRPAPGGGATFYFELPIVPSGETARP